MLSEEELVGACWRGQSQKASWRTYDNIFLVCEGCE